MSVVLSPAQGEAVRLAVAWYKGGAATPQEFYLAGFAGVGKSTVAEFIVAELRAHAGLKRLCACTPTGKAANVLRKKGVPDAMTCHGALYKPIEQEDGTVKFIFCPEDCPAAEADLVLIDEGSMVGGEMAGHFRAAARKILIMGDPAQLPPVNGQGEFTDRDPDVFLREIHRQAADNPIIRLSALARARQPIPVGDYGGGVVVTGLTKESQQHVYREDTQAICGLHRVRHVYTQRIRRQRGFEGPYPMKGERLICRRNNRELGIFNGGTGVALKSARERPNGLLRMDVEMEDLTKPLSKIDVTPWHFAQHFGVTERPRMFKGTEEFDWANLLTCHSAQGSEFPHVTLIDDSGAFRQDRWAWLYTGVTRASLGLVLLLREW